MSQIYLTQSISTALPKVTGSGSSETKTKKSLICNDYLFGHSPREKSAIPIIGHRDLQGYEMLRLPHFLDQSSSTWSTCMRRHLRRHTKISYGVCKI
jgi:hypothetical protein